jgi:Skp family chaperone for outer membrane proteins
MFQAKSLLSAVLAATLLTGVALAEQIGVVDMQVISQKYTKSQALAAQIKSKEQELQKLRDELAGQLKAAEARKMSPVEKKTLEDKLNGQFAAKFKEYREWALMQDQGLKEELNKAIQATSSSQKLDVVFPRQAVLQGGRDITEDVLNNLNK